MLWILLVLDSAFGILFRSLQCFWFKTHYFLDVPKKKKIKEKLIWLANLYAVGRIRMFMGSALNLTMAFQSLTL